MASKKQHNIVLRLVSKKGFRKVYQLLFNEVLMRGRIIETFVKGEKVWKTIWKKEQVNLYDPEWLLRRNSRIVTLSEDHPSMYQVKAYRLAHPVVAPSNPAEAA